MDKYYFDYVATTKPDEQALEIFKSIEQKFYMNYQSDLEAGDLLEQAKQKVKEVLALGEDKEVIFTTGGTESNNLAILGTFKNKKEIKHFITSSFEHTSVIEAFKELKRLGHEVTFVKPNLKGLIEVDDVLGEIQKNTALVSIMALNNEIGTVQNYKKIAQEVKRVNPNILMMVDFVQAIGKLRLDSTNLDFITISAHKIYGVKGFGILIKNSKIVVDQVIQGSKTSPRPGTLALGGIVSMVNSLKKIVENTEENFKNLKQKQDYFLNKINKNKMNLNGLNPIGVLSLTLNIRAQAQTVVEYLYEQGIVISTKSSCAKKLNTPSHVLKSINLEQDDIDRTIRISFGKDTTLKEIDLLAKELYIIVEKF